MKRYTGGKDGHGDMTTVADETVYQKGDGHGDMPAVAYSNLTDANVADANVIDANVIDATVADANPTDANVEDANVIDANVTDADVADAKVTDLTAADVTVSDAKDKLTSVADTAGQGFLGQFLATASSAPDAVAIQMGGAEQDRLTYADLLRKMESWCGIFEVLQVAPGERIVILLESGLEFIASFYALVSRSAMSLPVSCSLTPFELGRILADARPVGLVTTFRAYRAYRSAIEASASKGLRFILTIDGIDGQLEADSKVDSRADSRVDSKERYPAIVSLSSFRDKSFAGIRRPLEEPQGNPLITCHYTYKGFGYPLGAAHRYHDFTFCTRALTMRCPSCRDTSVLLLLPPCHVYGLTTSIIAPLASGCRLVLVPDIMQQNILDLLESCRIRFVFLVPAILLEIIAEARARQADGGRCSVGGQSSASAGSGGRCFSEKRGEVSAGFRQANEGRYSADGQGGGRGFVSDSFMHANGGQGFVSDSFMHANAGQNSVSAGCGKRFHLHPDLIIGTGGSFLGPSLEASVAEILGVEPCQGYGLTETLLVTSNFPGERKRGTLGKPIDQSIVVAIHDAFGRKAEAGQTGEIMIKGPAVIEGFLDRPWETAQIFRSGYFSTGDLGFLDEDGFLHFTGRALPITKVDAQMVDLAEVESILTLHPSVAEARAGVFACASGREYIVSSVILKKRAAVSACELQRFCRSYLSAHKVPRKIKIYQRYLVPCAL